MSNSQEISRILQEPCVGGSFPYRFESSSKIVSQYSHSLAVGWARMREKGAYQRRFGVPPEWIFELHPYHQTLLFELAKRQGTSLPQYRPRV